MANEITIRVTAKDDASRTFDVIDSKAKGLGSTLGKVGQIAGGFIAANVVAGAAGKLTGFLSQSVTAASNLGESINAVNVIFGKSSKTILDWGKNNATQFGLSQAAFNQLATPLGAMLKNAGIEDFADQTVDLTKRAADMASVFNTDVSSALEAIQAAIRGETDPIERYGVSLSAAAVEARALADGARLVDGELTSQAKTAARLALIFEQTAAVQGDFTNTSGEFANAQRIAAARTEELQAQIGMKLIPVTQKITELKLALVTVLAEKVIPALEELYAKHWPAVSQAIRDVVKVVEEWWPKLQPILAFVFEDVKTRIEGFIQAVGGMVQIVQGVADLVKAIAEGDWRAAWQAMNDVAVGIIDLMVGSILAHLGALPEKLYQLGKQAGQRFLDGLKENIVAAGLGGLPGGLGPLAGLGADVLGINHSGGTIGRTGTYLLQRGETVLPAGVSTTNNNQRSIFINNLNVSGGGSGQHDIELLLGGV